MASASVLISTGFAMIVFSLATAYRASVLENQPASALPQLHRRVREYAPNKPAKSAAESEDGGAFPGWAPVKERISHNVTAIRDFMPGPPKYSGIHAPRVLFVAGRFDHLTTPVTDGGNFVGYVIELFGESTLAKSKIVDPGEQHDASQSGWCIQRVPVAQGTDKILAVVVASKPTQAHEVDPKWKRFENHFSAALRVASRYAGGSPIWTPLIGSALFSGTEGATAAAATCSRIIRKVANASGSSVVVCDPNFV